MKKNAFTLIELIATIGLLGMLATITITISVKKINETKEKARYTMIESIELAAKQYVTEKGSEILEFNNNDNAYISLQTLVEKEYFTESLIDPTTKKSLPLTNEVYVTREESGEIISSYNVNQRKEPKLTLIGSYNEYVEEGKEYVEKGVIALSPIKQDVSENVTIKGTVDTTTPDIYKITYELDNVKITRNVIVYSKNISSEEILKASTYIERLYKTNNYQNDELYNPKFTLEGKEYDTGIRYTGANPNNYVYFNCEDIDSNDVIYGKENYDYANSCEVWRIIGVFDVKSSQNSKNERRVKIVNTTSTFQASWDSSASDVNTGYGINQWGESTYSDGTPYEGADLMKLLNGFYISKEGAECKYCTGEGQAGCNEICTKESFKNSNLKVLTNTAKKMFENVVWDIYALEWISEGIIKNNVNNVYLQEKGISAQNTGKSSCESRGSLTCNDKVTRTTNWTGNVGLMSVSDVIYANGWLYKLNQNIYLISTLIDSNYATGVWYTTTNSVTADDVRYKNVVSPSLYLKSSIKIIGGNGSSSSPYILAQ